ncbi:hypothetical protein BC834DRAFT_435646 [Gloeopeniophorella convolvens]|nr:hypothetical protein BC834DRAFT_435646 [Gloeopeniophorella convolvens]
MADSMHILWLRRHSRVGTLFSEDLTLRGFTRPSTTETFTIVTAYSVLHVLFSDGCLLNVCSPLGCWAYISARPGGSRLLNELLIEVGHNDALPSVTAVSDALHTASGRYLRRNMHYTKSGMKQGRSFTKDSHDEIESKTVNTTRLNEWSSSIQFEEQNEL